MPIKPNCRVSGCLCQSGGSRLILPLPMQRDTPSLPQGEGEADPLDSRAWRGDLPTATNRTQSRDIVTTTEAPTEAGTAPLAGLRVLEFTQAIMGPRAGLILADLGADVIKVEPAPGGDPTRLLTGFAAGFFGYF